MHYTTQQDTIRLIAMDMDDTLLNSQLEISPRTREALMQARAQGVAVTIATGRMFRSALPYAHSLGLEVPLITYNGALIKSPLTGEVDFHGPVPLEKAKEVLRLCRQNGWYVQSYVNDQLYVREMDKYARYYSQLSGVEATVVGDSLYELDQAPTKMLAMAEAEEIARMQELFRQHFNGTLNIARSKPTYLEITDPAVNKGVALARLAERLGIDRQQVMAFGDSGNDLEMLRYAGWGVAMGNARDSAKAAARLVTASNDEDGIAAVVEQYVLRQDTARFA
ncbi:MAG TPA: Cof-type HAD-IIB family hydrolase [Patescibacteria group bacterium]|nr:Cof-type HAD-IIB family hydrolase [Patescibacteria group bacterium]